MHRTTHACVEAVGGAREKSGKVCALYTECTDNQKYLTSQVFSSRALSTDPNFLSAAFTRPLLPKLPVEFSFTHNPQPLLLRLNKLFNYINCWVEESYGR